MNTEALREKIRTIKDEIGEIRHKKIPRTEVWTNEAERLHFTQTDTLKLRKTFQNKNDGDIRVLDFGHDLQLLTMSSGAATTGTVVIWNIASEERTNLIKLNNAWYVSAKVERSEGRLVAAGCLAGNLSIYDLTAQVVYLTEEQPTADLFGHEAIVNACSFIDNSTAVTVSGDQKIKVWDLQGQVAKTTLRGHTADIFSCAASPTNPNMVLTGAGDFSVRLWDVERGERRRGAVFTFDTGSRDINSVEFFPDGLAFATALSNSQTHFYDSRASCKLATFYTTTVFKQTASEEVRFSPSGRLMFVRYGNGKVVVYDVTGTSNQQGDEPVNNAVLPEPQGLTKAVSIAVHPAGVCLGVGDELRNQNHTTARIYWPRGR